MQFPGEGLGVGLARRGEFVLARGTTRLAAGDLVTVPTTGWPPPPLVIIGIAPTHRWL